jgi:hypothetical protein
MIRQIAAYSVFGLPVILISGIITLLLLLFTASISIMNRRGISYIPFKWHPRMAAISISLAIIHGILGLGFMFGF